MKKIDGRTKEGKAAKLKAAQEKMFGSSAIASPAFQSAQTEANKRARAVLDFEASLAELTPATTILQEAHDLIYGDREKDYGHPKKNLTDIANFWEMYLAGKYNAEHPMDAEDVCQMMVLLKMARGFNGPRKRDTIVDQVGYTGLLERVQR